MMSKNLNVLFVGTGDTVISELEKDLVRLGFESCEHAHPGVTPYEIEHLKPGLVILGPSLEHRMRWQCIHTIKIVDLSIPVLITGNDNGFSEAPPSAPFRGIHPLGDGLNRDHLFTTVERALQEKAECETGPDFPVLIGESGAMKRIREKIRSICDKDITVLITGESGTGKELIARSIFYHSTRKNGPFVKVNCTALPDELLESEVFGFQKGAFTGAHKNKPGRIELADGGTLFIDEIGDLSVNLQVKFLQVLEDKAFSRLGGTQDKVVDARVIAATNSDLLKKIREGTFRKDLFYRLNVMHIEAPPLRDRKEDIPILIHYLLNKYCFDFRKEPLGVPAKIEEYLCAYHWPGNVRELENVLRRGIVLRSWDFLENEFQLENRIAQESNPFPEAQSALAAWPDDNMGEAYKDGDFSLKKISKAYISEVEHQAILKALRETHWNRKRAAELLQVSYKTLLNRIAELGISP